MGCKRESKYLAQEGRDAAKPVEARDAGGKVGLQMRHKFLAIGWLVKQVRRELWVHMVINGIIIMLFLRVLHQ